MEVTKAKLKMKKMLLEGAEIDETSYSCEVLRYEEETDCIYLILKDSEILNISLDGIYECILYKGKTGRKCEGRVLERYRNQEGDILRFHVEKGFYKISINCVDKEES